MKHIVVFHLYNDMSGSPKVLKGIISGFLDKGLNVDLITSEGGVLDTLSSDNLNVIHYRYSFSASKFITMLRYFFVQIETFFIAFRYFFKRDVIFYINTLLPVGPALAGKIMGKRVIYHYHENAAIKGLVYIKLAAVMQRIASDIICVSESQRALLKRKDDVYVVYNALSPSFIKALEPDIEDAFRKRNILMLSSLKLYKGTVEFIELARIMPNMHFTLVVNDVQNNINSFIKKNNIQLTENIEIFHRQTTVVDFYNNASIVVNLTNKKSFIETFGMTALEAMACALPVIVPTVGGISELVKDGFNGYKIDVTELNLISEKINMIMSDFNLYEKLAKNAKTFSDKFRIENVVNDIIDIIEK